MRNMNVDEPLNTNNLQQYIPKFDEIDVGDIKEYDKKVFLTFIDETQQILDLKKFLNYSVILFIFNILFRVRWIKARKREKEANLISKNSNFTLVDGIIIKDLDLESVSTMYRKLSQKMGLLLPGNMIKFTKVNGVRTRNQVWV